MLYTPQLAKHLDLLRQRGYEELLGKRLVFTITTGRSGTQTLAEVFACAENTCSLHEPLPPYGKCLQRVQRNADLALEFLLEEKLPAIVAAGMPCYAETSHLLCKGFIEPILELGLRPHFVFVQRDCRAVAKSFTQLNSIPERTELGRDYMLSPADPCLLETHFWEDFTDYQLCYWYALEMKQRSQWYASLFDRVGIPYTWFDFADLRDSQKLVQLAKSCGMEINDDAAARIEAIIEHPINAKKDDKANAGKTAEVSNPSVLQHAESIVARACRTSTTDGYLSRMTVSRSKAA
jgi:hypothetical protein